MNYRTAYTSTYDKKQAKVGEEKTCHCSLLLPTDLGKHIYCDCRKVPSVPIILKSSLKRYIMPPIHKRIIYTTR